MPSSSPILSARSLLQDAERRRLIQVLLAATGGACGVLVAVSLGRAEWASALIAAVVLAVVGLGYGLFRLGHVLPTAIGLPVVVLAGAAFLMLDNGGIHDLAILCLPIVVLVAGLLLGPWAATLFALLGSAVALVAVVAERRGLIETPYAVMTQMGDAAVVLVLMSMTAVLLGAILASLNRSLTRLRWNEEALEESNLQLASQAEVLKASEARWRSLLGNAPDRILQVKRDGAVELDNRPADDRDDVLTSLHDLVAVEDRPLLTEALASVIDSGEPTSREVRGTIDGTWLSLRIGPLDAPGAIGSVIVIVTDVSDHRRAEEDRDRLEEQLLQAQKMEALGQLAGGVAHDFNNLLTVISGHSSLLEEEVSDSVVARASLQEIQAAQQRAAALTRQLLAFGRRQVLQPRVVDLNDVILGIGDMLGRVIGEEVRLQYELAPEVVRVRADPVQIEQMVLNLAVNARDAMPEGGLLRIATRLHRAEVIATDGVTGPRQGEFSVLVVEDTGIGMDESIRSHIFEPFFTTKPRGKGTGLGLSSVYGVVKQSGGQIAVQSRPGEGTIFEVFLPAVEAPLDAPVPTRALSQTVRGSETILLVEDDPPMRRLLADVLAGQGYRVLAAGDGDEALELASGHAGDIDLLVTDLVMPGLDGRSLASVLRESRRGIPVLFMSGYAHDTLDGMSLWQDSEFLQKPFTLQSLGRTVRQMLDR